MSWRLGTAGALAFALACGKALTIDPPPPIDAGTCRTTTWTNRMAPVVPRAVALDRSGRLFATGLDDRRAWVAELDPCTGGILHEFRFAIDDRETKITAMAATDSALLLSGHVENDLNLAQQGLFVRVDKTLTTILETRLFDGSGWLELDQVSETADGMVWLAGEVNIFGGPNNQRGWVVRGTGDAGCSAFVGQSIGGLVPLDGERALVAMQTDAGTTTIARLSGCAIEAETPMALPDRGGPGDMRRAGEGVALVGSMGGGANADKGFVGVGSMEGGWTFAAPLDPNLGADMMVRVVSDGEALFAAAHQNASLTSATPTVYRFSLPLAGGDAPAWSSLAFGADLLAVSALEASPRGEDALYVVGRPPGADGGTIARCSKTTGCAK